MTGIAIVSAHTPSRRSCSLRDVDPRMTKQRALFLKIVVLLEYLHRHSTAERVRKITGYLQPFIIVSRLS